MKWLSKILDDYYTQKLIWELKWEFILQGLDCKFKTVGKEILIMAKPKKWRDDEYIIILKMQKRNSLKYFCDLDNFMKKFKERINEFCKDIKY